MMAIDIIIHLKKNTYPLKKFPIMRPNLHMKNQIIMIPQQKTIYIMLKKITDITYHLIKSICLLGSLYILCQGMRVKTIIILLQRTILLPC